MADVLCDMIKRVDLIDIPLKCLNLAWGFFTLSRKLCDKKSAYGRVCLVQDCNRNNWLILWNLVQDCEQQWQCLKLWCNLQWHSPFTLQEQNGIFAFLIISPQRSVEFSNNAMLWISYLSLEKKVRSHLQRKYMSQMEAHETLQKGVF